MRKLFVLTFISLIIFSCRKYDRPFISFKSPEKRLINKTWKLTKKIHSTGFEESPNESLEFKIGADSNVVINGIIEGSWSWMWTMDKDKFDKERIKLIDPLYNRTYEVKVLTKNELQLHDLGSLIDYYYESN